MNKNKFNILALFALCATAANVNAFEAGDVIGFEDGVMECPIGGEYPNCIYGVTGVASGSYFALDVNGNGRFDGSEKVAISSGLAGGIIIGEEQHADVYGNCIGAVPTAGGAGGVDESWCFFGNQGAHQVTTTPVTDNGDGTLDFSGWGVKWANENIPLYGGTATVICSTTPCRPNSNYVIEYFTTIPKGPFTGVSYQLHIVGAITEPSAHIAITADGGASQECSMHGGSNVTFNSSVNVPEGDSISSIEWQVGGTVMASGEQITEFLSLGSHNISARLTTVNGLSSTSQTQVEVEDTTSPHVTADFFNRLSNQSLQSLRFFNFLKVDAEAVDACDPSPVVEAMYGAPVEDDDSLLVLKHSGRVILDIPSLELTVRATDSSGNGAIATRAIDIRE